MPKPNFKTWNDIITNPNNCLLNHHAFNTDDLYFYKCKPTLKYKTIKLFCGVRRYRTIFIQ